MRVIKKAAALVLAVGVHAFTLMWILSGGWVIGANPGSLFAWLGGGLLLLIGGLLFPKPRRLPADAEVVERGAAPELYGVAERVAGAVGVPAPVGVAVDDLAVGAEYLRVGWGRRPVLLVGLPLWLALPPRQRVVLLVRAYGEAKDDGVVAGGALWTLAQWRETFRSGKILAARGETHMYMATILGAAAPRGSYEAAGMLDKVLGTVLGWPVLLLERALLRLVRDVAPRPAPAWGIVTDVEKARLAELMASRSFLAPLQAAALRGAAVTEIRRSAAVCDDGASRHGREELLSEDASDRVDAELSRHYSRAIRALGLIW
ncbi:hypothetical protein ABGB17_12150 [Sphaerisporangium sp. B11E5]|uniref:hypothetical protein n=1 Tax=Sphaerisporangium sp. B11E5 TaxID=3153563 RepID=UPI00325E4FED